MTAVDRPAALGVEPGVTLLDGDLVAEEPCCLGAAVGDEGLGLGKLQLETISQELPYPVLDFLGLVPWPRESEQEVVGIPYVPQAPLFRVVGVAVRQRPEERAQ